MDMPGLQIIISSGPEASPKAALGFATAAAALATGMPVHVFLVMDGTRWAFQSEGCEPEIFGFPAIAELMDTIQSAGGQIEICSNCVGGSCDHESPRAASEPMRPGVVPAGLATVAIRTQHMQTLTF